MAERSRRHNHRDHRGHRSQEEVLVRNLVRVRIAAGEDLRLGKDKGEITITNLIRHALCAIWFLGDEASRCAEGELERRGWWSVLTKKMEDYKWDQTAGGGGADQFVQHDHAVRMIPHGAASCPWSMALFNAQVVKLGANGCKLLWSKRRSRG